MDNVDFRSKEFDKKQDVIKEKDFIFFAIYHVSFLYKNHMGLFSLLEFCSLHFQTMMSQNTDLRIMIPQEEFLIGSFVQWLYNKKSKIPEDPSITNISMLQTHLRKTRFV